MNKEEILSASRKENRNQDLFEVECIKKGSRIAYVVGIIMCCMICFLQWLFTKTINWGCWIVNYSIISTMFFVKAVNRRKKHEICVTVLYVLITIFFCIGFAMSLKG